ncbi:hypothetical protein [Streptomyces sp. NPDC091212]|uniref:hypothetical protein n=1 Tax=Streptomyces sp. NPDC091212 TaxID=3155191 RepID=UPI00343EC4A2
MRSTSTTRAPRRAATASAVRGLAAGAIGGLLLMSAAAPAVAADRAEPGAELVFGRTAPVDGLRPGGTHEQSFTVRNRGTAPATDVVLFLDGTKGLSFTEKYSNCVYEETPAQDEGAAQVNAVCDIAETLEPGVTYVPEAPVGVHVLDHALYEHLSFSVLEAGSVFPGDPQHGGGADPVLRLVERRPQPADPGTPYVGERLDVAMTAENTADFALTGAKVRGLAGETVTADVTFANRGPAWVANDVSTPIGVFDVGIPPGTTVVGAPEFCVLAKAAGTTTYRCTTPYGYADEDSERAYGFRLRIDKVVPNATGGIAFVKGDHRWGTLPFDKNPANNTAALVVNASGGEETSGGTGSTGGGTGGGTAGSSGGASAGTSTGGGAGGGTGASPQGGSTPPPAELAETGAGAGRGPLLAGAAVAALLVAAGTALTARRRPGSRG